jgi:hypothetical protein
VALQKGVRVGMVTSESLETVMTDIAVENPGSDSEDEEEGEEEALVN